MTTEARQDMGPVEVELLLVGEAEHLRVQEVAHLVTELLEIGDHLRIGEEVTGELPGGIMVMPLLYMMNNNDVFQVFCGSIVGYDNTLPI